MAKIYPFRGIRYNPNKVTFSDVVTQPYDKITKESQEFYYRKSPYNIVRIILNKENSYTAANNFFNEWFSNNILIQDNEPSIYPYYQEYEGKVRKGFIALLQLEDFSTGVVLPHERTLSAPKEDRLRLLRATNANFGQIFLLYSDAEQKIPNLLDNVISGIPPLIEVQETFEPNAYHKLWRISNKDIIDKVCELMLPKTLLIADGHHRYETSLNYSKENPTAKYIMATFISMEDPGLTILPTHRAVYGIDTTNFMDNVKKFFTIEQSKDLSSLINELQGKHHTYGVYDGKYWLIKLKDFNLVDKFIDKDRAEEYRKLDITILHSVILENILKISRETILRKEKIDFLREIKDGISGVDSGKYNLFFILNPTKIEEVQKISAKREVMPQKSTDFYPKLISGLVIYKIES